MRALNSATFVEDLERELLRDPLPRPSEAQLEAVGRLLEWMRPHLETALDRAAAAGVLTRIS